MEAAAALYCRGRPLRAAFPALKAAGKIAEQQSGFWISRVARKRKQCRHPSIRNVSISRYRKHKTIRSRRSPGPVRVDRDGGRQIECTGTAKGMPGSEIGRPRHYSRFSPRCRGRPPPQHRSADIAGRIRQESVPPRRPTPSQARKAIPGYRGRGARHRAFSKAVIQKQHRSFPASMAYPKGVALL